MPCRNLENSTVKRTWLAYDYHMTCTRLAHDLHMTCTWLAHDLHMPCTWLPNLNPFLRDCSIEKADIGDKTTTRQDKTNTGTRDDYSSSKKLGKSV